MFSQMVGNGLMVMNPMGSQSVKNHLKSKNPSWESSGQSFAVILYDTLKPSSHNHGSVENGPQKETIQSFSRPPFSTKPWWEKGQKGYYFRGFLFLAVTRGKPIMSKKNGSNLVPAKKKILGYIITLPKTNSKFAPENRPRAPKGNETSIPRKPIFRCKLAGFVSGRDSYVSWKGIIFLRTVVFHLPTESFLRTYGLC